MGYRQEYGRWLAQELDRDTREELEALAGDEGALEDRFYKQLEFGTAGMRGLIGAGSNRMNLYTVAAATQGLADVIRREGEEAARRGVAIAYDSRRCSDVFAREAALVLCGNGVRAYLFDALRPTPELSFALRHLGCVAGINITASHNPAPYNGYKVYWEDGGQMPPEPATRVQQARDALGSFADIRRMGEEEAREKGLLHIIGPEVDAAYLAALKGVLLSPEAVAQAGNRLKIVYTPLHGAGNVLVRRALGEAGFSRILVVPEQEQPDGNFPTIPFPNPEEPEAMRLAIELARREGANLVIGTDPDGDRLGVAVRDGGGSYRLLSGNQIGCLLLHYILTRRRQLGNLPADGVVIKTIVSTEMTRAIAQSFGVEVMEVLTGFKFIAEKIQGFEESGRGTFLFGFEESYGYLAGDFVRDKDAVMAAQLVCEAAAWYDTRDMTLYEALVEMYETYGHYVEQVASITAPGKEGGERIDAMMRDLRTHPPHSLGGLAITGVRDYKEGLRRAGGKTEKLDLPASDVLYYELEERSWLAVRPSGTEPKIKVYAASAGDTQTLAQARCGGILAEIKARLDAMAGEG